MAMILDAVLPVFLITALGYLLFQAGFLDPRMNAGINRLVYFVGLPSLLFHKIYNQTLQWNSVANILWAFFVALLATICLAYFACFFRKLPREQKGAFIQAAYRGNLGFIGLPVVLFASSDNIVEQVGSLAAVALAPAAIVFNLVAVGVLLRHQPADDAPRQKVLKSFVTNPLILSGLLGVGFALLQIPLPTFLDRSLAGLSQMAVPLALIGLGGSFAEFGFRSLGSRPLLINSTMSMLIKILISPILGVICALLFGLNPIEARIVVVYLATPTAIASYVLVGQMGGDQKLAATIIVFATVGSILSLPLALATTEPTTWSALQELVGITPASG